MSNIPFTAIGAAFTPVQRAANDLLRARKVQSDKDSHHTQDVEELDDTAVNSVHDRHQRGGRQRHPNSRPQDGQPQEKVEIAALSNSPPHPAPSLTKSPSQLDISA